MENDDIRAKSFNLKSKIDEDILEFATEVNSDIDAMAGISTALCSCLATAVSMAVCCFGKNQKEMIKKILLHVATQSDEMLKVFEPDKNLVSFFKKNSSAGMQVVPCNNSGTAPKKFKELSTFVISEVSKTLIEEGFQLGAPGIGEVHFEKDANNPSKMKRFTLSIKFIEKEEKDGNVFKR